MKPARLAVLGISLLAAVVATVLVMQSGKAPVTTVVQQAAAPQAKTVDVLVAASELSMGQGLKAEHLRW